jgi:threonine/homoserine/homoserine lactone efflux protein
MVMQLGTMLVFAATVMPLVCTPGPDILFVASQGLSGGTTAAMRANLGVLVGYLMHAILAAFGVAAVVAASPVLFEILRWVGVLIWLISPSNSSDPRCILGAWLLPQHLTTRWSGEAF